MDSFTITYKNKTTKNIKDSNCWVLDYEPTFENLLLPFHKYGKLKLAQVWWAKNSSKHTLEISKIFGSLVDPLAAVQSLDETVLKNIKRDNIKLDTMTDLLEEWNKENIGVITDVLVGLPGESL